jgi:hypothetical protein
MVWLDGAYWLWRFESGCGTVVGECFYLDDAEAASVVMQ